MAQLKANSTFGGSDIANINLDNVSRANFSATHLAEIKGNTGVEGVNGSNGANGSSATVGKSGSTLSSTGNSNINLASVTSIVYNGSNLGYHKIYLNGTRIYEKYQVDNTYQTWVTEGHNEVSWIQEANTITTLHPSVSYTYTSNPCFTASYSYCWTYLGYWSGTGEHAWYTYRKVTSWVDTSHFITEGSIDDTYFY